jgi:hypothetical protein
MPGRKTALKGRGSLKPGNPPWFSSLLIEEARYRELQDELERCRARRSLMLFLGYRYFGASQHWLAARMQTTVGNVNRLTQEGKTVALSGVGDGDLEKLVEMCFGKDMVSQGWDGAGEAG